MLPTIQPVINPLAFAVKEATPGDAILGFPEEAMQIIADSAKRHSLIPPKELAAITKAFSAISVNGMPKELIRIIAEYSSSGYALALQDFPTDTGRISEKRTRQAIRQARLEVLISHDSDPVIKRQILIKGMFGQDRHILKGIFDEIRRKGYRLNLDRTDLTNINLSGFNLSGMSAINAIFTDVFMLATRLEGVDLTNAHIENTWIINANMSKSILTKATVLGNSFFRKVDLSGADTSDITLVNTSFYMVNVSGVVTNNFYFQELINHAKKSSRFSSLLRNVELTGVFSTTSGIDLAATKTMLEEVGASPNGHPTDPGAGCTIS